MKQLPATAIRDLVEGGLLKSCDVLLMHTKRNPRACLIRLGTRSYWNHALMINVARDTSCGRIRTLIIDPKMSGLEVEDVSYYLQKPEKYDVGVKRFEQGWFQSQQANGMCCRERVLGLALSKVSEPPRSGRTWRSVHRLLRQFKLVFHKKRERLVSRPDKPLDVTAYTCSGFVQWCYYQSACQIPGESGIDKSRLQEIIFNPHIESQLPSDYELLSTTPGDLANSDKLSWKYVVKDGVVWELSIGEEADQLCK